MQKEFYGIYDHGFGESWKDVLVYGREGYTTSVADYHSHGFYEVNLILSGNVRILLPDRSVETDLSHLVLMGPGAPHFIACKPDRLYRRLYLCFSEAFVRDCGEAWGRFRRMFEGSGSVMAVSEQQCHICRQLIEAVDREEDPYRRKLLILYLLSYIFGKREESAAEILPVPACVIGALTYVRSNYAQRLVAEELAEKLHVGRTTLMMAFKKHTGSTLNEYTNGVRVKEACIALRQGKTVQETAECCGFSDTGAMIRVFRKQLGLTPGEYRRREGT